MVFYTLGKIVPPTVVLGYISNVSLFQMNFPMPTIVEEEEVDSSNYDFCSTSEDSDA
jgi:DsbC/DsbD-like thiol-disulfide interchange protein